MRGFARRVRAIGVFALAGLALAGCLAPAGPDDPRGWNHAAWCGTMPASGYCIVDDAR